MSGAGSVAAMEEIIRGCQENEEEGRLENETQRWAGQPGGQ